MTNHTSAEPGSQESVYHDRPDSGFYVAIAIAICGLVISICARWWTAFRNLLCAWWDILAWGLLFLAGLIVGILSYSNTGHAKEGFRAMGFSALINLFLFSWRIRVHRYGGQMNRGVALVLVIWAMKEDLWALIFTAVDWVAYSDSFGYYAGVGIGLGSLMLSAVCLTIEMIDIRKSNGRKRRRSSSTMSAVPDTEYSVDDGSWSENIGGATGELMRRYNR